jgi:hypothetical protein
MAFFTYTQINVYLYMHTCTYMYIDSFEMITSSRFLYTHINMIPIHKYIISISIYICIHIHLIYIYVDSFEIFTSSKDLVSSSHLGSYVNYIIYTYIYKRIYIYIYIHIYLYICIYQYIYINTYLQKCSHIYKFYLV